MHEGKKVRKHFAKLGSCRRQQAGRCELAHVPLPDCLSAENMPPLNNTYNICNISEPCHHAMMTYHEQPLSEVHSEQYMGITKYVSNKGIRHNEWGKWSRMGRNDPGMVDSINDYLKTIQTNTTQPHLDTKQRYDPNMVSFNSDTNLTKNNCGRSISDSGNRSGGSELTPLDPKQKFLPTEFSDTSQHDLIGSEK